MGQVQLDGLPVAGPGSRFHEGRSISTGVTRGPVDPILAGDRGVGKNPGIPRNPRIYGILPFVHHRSMKRGEWPGLLGGATLPDARFPKPIACVKPSDREHAPRSRRLTASLGPIVQGQLPGAGGRRPRPGPGPSSEASSGSRWRPREKTASRRPGKFRTIFQKGCRGRRATCGSYSDEASRDLDPIPSEPPQFRPFDRGPRDRQPGCHRSSSPIGSRRLTCDVDTPSWKSIGHHAREPGRWPPRHGSPEADRGRAGHPDRPRIVRRGPARESP